jgi:tetratricopeptide (TPR) repeat protein
MRFFAILFILAGSLLFSVSAFAQTPGQDALRAFDALRAGDWELANVYATRALEAGTLAPGDQAAVYGYRGDARRHLDDLQDAVLDYTRALDLGLPPAYAARVYNNRGMAMFAADLYGNAVEDYTAAIQSSPRHTSIAASSTC